MAKRLLCLDFDGVLHSYTSGWQGAGVVRDPPVPGAMQFLGAVFEDQRFNVAIYSSRSKNLLGRYAMKRWLSLNLLLAFGNRASPRSWDLLADDIYDWVQWPWFKPAAFVTLDDRAMRFRGSWPALATLDTFEPYRVGRVL